VTGGEVGMRHISTPPLQSEVLSPDREQRAVPPSSATHEQVRHQCLRPHRRPM